METSELDQLERSLRGWGSRHIANCRWPGSGHINHGWTREMEPPDSKAQPPCVGCAAVCPFLPIGSLYPGKVCGTKQRFRSAWKHALHACCVHSSRRCPSKQEEVTVLLQEPAMELGGPCVPSFSLSFILFSKYLLSACHVPGPVLGLEYNGVFPLQSPHRPWHPVGAY